MCGFPALSSSPYFHNAKSWSLLFENVFPFCPKHRDCKNELDALLEERPNFSCSWDVSIRGGHVTKAGKKKKPDAVEIFLTFVRTRGLRLIDLFRILTKDSNATTITKNEFITGMKRLNVPLKDHQLRALFESLDVNGDENVEFYEFLGSRGHYLKTARK